jgi:hypothetical protein
MIQSFSRLYFLIAWAFFCQIQSPPNIAAEEFTADEVLKRSREAMKPPIRYRSVSRGISTLVCQKVLANGTIATRLEASSPVPKISLILDDSMCEFYPDRGVAIDATFMQRSASAQANSILDTLKGKAPASFQMQSIVLEDGRECFEITSTFAPSLSAAVENALPQAMKKQAQAMIPRQSVTVIEKKGFRLVEVRAVSQAGYTISESQYSAIEQPVELPDDLFLPPDGVELLKPQTKHEYVSMVREILSLSPIDEASSEFLSNGPSEPMKMSDVVSRPDFDFRTGLAIPRSLSGIGPTERSRKAPSLRTGGMEPSAAQILARTRRAMNGTLRYRLFRDGIETIVYKLEFSDGTTATGGLKSEMQSSSGSK